MKQFIDKRSIIVFGCVFAIAVTLQVYQWSFLNVFDDTLWTRAVAETTADILRPQHVYTDRYFDPAFIYPGATILLLGSTISHFGVEPNYALRLSIALLLALFCALSVTACARILPQTKWWIPAALLIVPSPLYAGATPASGVVIPIIVFLTLCISIAEESAKRGILPNTFLVFLGTIGGIAGATRLDVSAFVLGTGLLLLWLRVKWRVLIAVAAAATTFLLLDPFLWSSPMGYAKTFFTSFVSQQESINSVIGLTNVVYIVGAFAPIALLSIVIWTILLLRRPRALPLGRRFVCWFLVITLAMCSVLLLANFWQIWYVYPFIAVWQILLPLLILHLILDLQKKRPIVRESIAVVCISSIFATFYALPTVVDVAHRMGMF